MKNIQKQYQDLLEGTMSKANFMRNVRMQFPQHISPVSSFEDSVKILKGKRILNEDKKPIGVYGHNPNAEMDEYRGIDYVNYYQAYKGIQYELSKMPEITDENYIKARKKVVANILKDPDAYKDLQLANFKAVKDMDKDLEMKDVKKDNLVDKPNEMKVVKKDAKGNTEATLEKKEARKSKTAKVPVMTQAPKGNLKAFETPGKEKVMALKEAYKLEKNLDSLKSNATGALSAHKLSHGGDTKNKPVALKAIEDIKNATSTVQIFNILHKTGLFDKVEIKAILKKHDSKTPFTVANESKVQSLKEHILDELMQPNLEHEYINIGSRVKKKGLEGYDAAQVGNVTGFDGDTATVKWDNDSVEHLQINVLTKKEIPQLPDAAERWAKIPDSPFMKREEEEVKESEQDKETRLKSLKEKIVKALEKEGYAVQTQGGQTLSAGKNTSQGITTARDLERVTGDQLTVIDTKTGRKTQA